MYYTLEHLTIRKHVHTYAVLRYLCLLMLLNPVTTVHMRTAQPTATITNQQFTYHSSNKEIAEVHSVSYETTDKHAYCIGEEKAVINTSQQCASMILVERCPSRATCVVVCFIVRTRLEHTLDSTKWLSGGVEGCIGTECQRKDQNFVTLLRPGVKCSGSLE